MPLYLLLSPFVEDSERLRLQWALLHREPIDRNLRCETETIHKLQTFFRRNAGGVKGSCCSCCTLITRSRAPTGAYLMYWAWVFPPFRSVRCF